jgi:hypothetical protein
LLRLLERLVGQNAASMEVSEPFQFCARRRRQTRALPFNPDRWIGSWR